MDYFVISFLGVPGLGTTLLAVGASLVSAYVAVAVARTREQVAQGVAVDPHDDVEGLAQGSSKRARNKFDRIAPLFYEKTSDGTWKISLGRVAFWMTQIVFLAMCITAMVSLKDAQDVSSGLTTLYLGVLSMLFLTNLGLLAYNLGSKFTDPMKQFIINWSGPKPNVGGSLGGRATLPVDESVAAPTGGLHPDELDSTPLAEGDMPSEQPPQKGDAPPWEDEPNG